MKGFLRSRLRKLSYTIALISWENVKIAIKNQAVGAAWLYSMHQIILNTAGLALQAARGQP